MALHVPKAPGFSQMLKDGARHFSGLEEAVFRNINACKEFASTVRSAYGPNGMNKIIINHFDKLFVTNDAATIIRELEVEHPAAKMLILASQMQEQEVGDGTNFVIIFAGALLEHAEGLLRMGLTPVEVSEGYERALDKVLEVLPKLVCSEVKDLRSVDVISKAMKSSLMSKQYGHEEYLASLITKACISVTPENTSFNVDNIRVCKILGGGLMDSAVIPGMVFKKQVEGEVSRKSKAKIAVYTGPVDIGTTETKGTVLIKTAEELRNFSTGEENLLEKQIKAIKDAGADIIISGAKFSDMALHFINKSNIMAVKIPSKFDIRRLCKITNATALPFLTPPAPEELGYIDEVYVDELGDTSIVVFKMESKESKISTVVIRGATDNFMDDIERAIDDGVNTYKTFTKDVRLVPGAGAVEIELSRLVREYAETLPGLEQYAVHKFADALETLPKAIADNSGLKSADLLAALLASHQQGAKNNGINIVGEELENQMFNACEEGICDTYLSKFWGLKYAVNATTTVLRVDQIIMAKRAGGPAPPKQGGGLDNDDD